MKRTRNGCHTCRQRRVKCDETHPRCKNCAKRSLLCNYELRFRWIREMFVDENSPSASPTNSEDDFQQDSETPEWVHPTDDYRSKKRKSDSRKGPMSVKRKIGQEVVSRVEMSEDALNNLPTVMEEVPFESDDELLAVHGSSNRFNMFRKFILKRKESTASSSELSESKQSLHKSDESDDDTANGTSGERVTNPILLHSPLFRSFSIANPTLTTFESILPPAPYATDCNNATNISDTYHRKQTARMVSSHEILNHLVLASPTVAHTGTGTSPELATVDMAIELPPVNSGFHPLGPEAQASKEPQEHIIDPNVIFSRSLKRTNNFSQDLAFEIPPLDIDALQESLETPVLSPTANNDSVISSFHHSNGFLAGVNERELYNYFVDVVADDLVPIPFEESPYYKNLPLRAEHDKFTWDLLVAFGATHRAVKLSNGKSGEMHPKDFDVVNRLILRCECRLELALAANPRSSQSLLGATLLSMIELDRGSAKRWWLYLDVALHIIHLRLSFADWELDNEINSMLFRVVGFMTSMANLLCGPASKTLEFPSWPQWSGSLDHLTGVDLNLLPLFSEVAFLTRSLETQFRTILGQPTVDICLSYLGALERDKVKIPNVLKDQLYQAMTSSPLIQRIRMRSMRIFQRINDYWIEEFVPDSDITAMCILFQEALQIHLLRRVLLFPAAHPVIQRVITLGMSHLEKYIAPQSHLQRNMAFILATLASEALDLRHRTVLLIRMRNMAEAGFKHHWTFCRDLKQCWKANESLICSRKYTLLPR